jgi:beta-1,4-mannosyltransferase
LFARLGIRGAGPVGFIVSPTSWTADEDFDVVIDAVLQMEDRIRGWEAKRTVASFPGSGDSGHRRRSAARGVRTALSPVLPARRIQLRTRWLDPEDYPRIVGSADLGSLPPPLVIGR